MRIERSWLARAALSAMVVVALSPLIADPAAAQSTPTCFGRAATIVGTDGNDTLRGTDGRDVIAGMGGRDTIYGLRGDDLLCGKGGITDVLYGGAGNDKLDGGAGNDTHYGGPGNDEIVAGPGSEGVYGDNMHGGPGDDRLVGGPAVDNFWPGSGRDTAIGSTPDDGDTVHYDKATQGMRVNLLRHRASGEGRDVLRSMDSVIGSEFDDTIVGNERLNSLDGGAGSDVLRGGRGLDFLVDLGTTNPRRRDGHDRIAGGRGTDHLYIGRGADVAQGGPGDDKINRYKGGNDRISGDGGRDRVHFVVGPVTVDLASGNGRGPGTFSISGVEDVWGSPRDDTILGTGGPNFTLPMEGSDTVDLRGGTDTVGFAFLGFDRDITVDLTKGTARGEGRDRLRAIENVRTGAGNDTIYGDSGPNRISTSGGEDEIHGRGGADRIDGSLARDRLFGGAGNDTIDGGTFQRGNQEATQGADLLVGGPGNDRLFGRLGNDRLDGGSGTDRLDGGSGDDECVNGEELVDCEARPEGPAALLQRPGDLPASRP